MHIFEWADDVLKNYPSTTTKMAKDDEWIGVESAVDVLTIARGVKTLQTEIKGLKKKQEEAISLVNKALLLLYDNMHKKIDVTIYQLLTRIKQILQRKK